MPRSSGVTVDTAGIPPEKKRALVLLDPMWEELGALSETEITEPEWKPLLLSLLRSIMLKVEELEPPKAAPPSIQEH